MTDQWVSQEANAVNTNEPVLLTITNTDKNNQKVFLHRKFTYSEIKIHLNISY